VTAGSPDGAAGFGEFRRDAIRESLDNDFMMGMLEDRITALEEVAAARWPRRILLAARLSRALRASVAPYRWAGPAFACWRAEAAGSDWREAVQRGGQR
jgi:hypothetical protein